MNQGIFGMPSITQRPPVLIEEKRVATRAAAIEFDVPSGFRHFTMSGLLRCVAVINEATVRCRVNRDAGATSYNWSWLRADNATAGAQQSTGDSSILVGYAPGASIAAGHFAAISMIALDYTANYNFKNMLFQIAGRGGTMLTLFTHGIYTPPSSVSGSPFGPITSIRIFNDSDDWVTNSYLALYGIPA